jgi:hypothetical protein
VEVAELVFNDSGHPLLSDAPLRTRIRLPASVPMPPKTSLPGCTGAGGMVFCPDSSGAIHRMGRPPAAHGMIDDPDSDAVVAQSRAGTSIAAAPIGGNHVVLAYQQEAATTEGMVREARAMLDDAAPVPLSEEGSGATFVDLAARGDEVVALTIDARVAMSPAHARILRVRDGKLEVGKDAVIFVGGPAERHTQGTLALDAEGTAYALIAVAESAQRFGMATVRISDPPQDDERVVWSFYPSGVDPAPIAASRGVSPIRVARVRPSGPDADASNLLEIGELDASGEFQGKCVVAEAAYVKDVALAIDGKAGVWLFWRDTRGSHLERRALP